jgi:hypothetical protein
MKKLVVAVALAALAPLSSVALACDGSKPETTNTSSAPQKGKKDSAQQSPAPGKDKKDGAQQTRS